MEKALAGLKKRQKPEKPHEFTKVPEFDQAMRKLVGVPKEDVEQREKESRTPREKG